MTAARIRVYNHIPDFIGLDDDAVAQEIERLKQRLTLRNPMAVPVRRTIGSAIEPLETAPDRDALLHGLLEQDLSTVARTTLLHLAGALPPLAGRMICHLVPNGGRRGSGTGWGKDRLLATAPCKGDAGSWLRFVIAHEYSHTQRNFGLFQPETVRDHLIFEGLAMVLAETMVPKPIPYP